ncbi:MAG: helix-turn-helix domain-containing protein [Gammaproteobacteria bacterium]
MSRQSDSADSAEKFSHSLSDALAAHFRNLNGHDCGNLHRLVMSAVEAELVAFALKKCGDNCSEAARMLGISRTTLMRKKAAAEQTHEN